MIKASSMELMCECSCDGSCFIITANIVSVVNRDVRFSAFASLIAPWGCVKIRLIFLLYVDSNEKAWPQAAGFPGQSILSAPMSNLAMAYSSSLASQGREMMDKNVRAGFRLCPI